MLAGRAVMTIKSEKSGRHFTFKFRVNKNAASAHRLTHYVDVRTGGADSKLFEYVGYLTALGEFEFGKKYGKNLGLVAPPFSINALRWMLRHLAKNEMPPQAELWHEGTCGRCSRPLTDPDSIARGLGPECAGKVQPRCFAA